MNRYKAGEFSVLVWLSFSSLLKGLLQVKCSIIEIAVRIDHNADFEILCQVPASTSTCSALEIALCVLIPLAFVAGLYMHKYDVYVYAYVCVYVHVYMYMYTCICIYVYT